MGRQVLVNFFFSRLRLRFLAGSDLPKITTLDRRTDDALRQHPRMCVFLTLIRSYARRTGESFQMQVYILEVLFRRKGNYHTLIVNGVHILNAG